MQLRWTKVPFPARNTEEFSRGLSDWLGRVFYETLPAQGFEVREEQIYTTFRMARALVDGQPYFAEAGPGTGKTFAYLLPAVCYARFRGSPVLVASASGVLQAQLANPQGDIRTLSRILGLEIDARLATDPVAYACEVKVDRLRYERPMKGWQALHNWAKRTRTGARSEVPKVPDVLWAHVAWDSSLPCDTCRHRGTCHVMAARRHYREAADLVVTDHRLFARDLLTRAERHEAGQMPLLPAYSAVVLDEGHHLPETWQRVQGYELNTERFTNTLGAIRAGYTNQSGTTSGLGNARFERREYIGNVLLAAAERESRRFLAEVLAAAEPGEGKRHVAREGEVLKAAVDLTKAVEALQDELVTEEAMQEGTAEELRLRAFQTRLDEVTAALALFQSEQAVPWVEGEDLWVVARNPLPVYGDGRLTPGTPVLFTSATLEPAYAAGVLQLPTYGSARVGVPFNLAEQVLVYEPGEAGDEVGQVAAIMQAMQGRTLVLLDSLAEVERYRKALKAPWRLLWEGDAERGAMLANFRADRSACLLGATFWEGVDVPGESLSCVIIPRLPFPAHDPLIRERRRQAEARGEDPFAAVDLPEMLLRLKQGAGRLIRTAEDRGVLALLDRSYLDKPWADLVEAALPEGAERTDDLARVAEFCEPDQTAGVSS